jgi:hypothetical protein
LKNDASLGGGAPLRVAVDLVALRATAEGREIAHALSTFPQAIASRDASGVDAFEVLRDDLRGLLTTEQPRAVAKALEIYVAPHEAGP